MIDASKEIYDAFLKVVLGSPELAAEYARERMKPNKGETFIERETHALIRVAIQHNDDGGKAFTEVIALLRADYDAARAQAAARLNSLAILEEEVATIAADMRAAEFSDLIAEGLRNPEGSVRLAAAVFASELRNDCKQSEQRDAAIALLTAPECRTDENKAREAFDAAFDLLDSVPTPETPTSSNPE